MLSGGKVRVAVRVEQELDRKLLGMLSAHPAAVKAWNNFEDDLAYS